MKKHSLIILIPFFFCKTTLGVNPAFIDTPLNKKNIHTSLNTKFDDDTVKMITAFYAQKRKRKKIGAAVSAVGGGLAAYGFIKETEGPPSSNTGGVHSPNAGLGFMGLLWLCIFSTAYFSTSYFRYIPKRLSKILNRYQSGKGLPRWLKNNNSFKEFCKTYSTLK